MQRFVNSSACHHNGNTGRDCCKLNVCLCVCRQELMEYYLTNPKGKHIKEYVSIISGSPVYPIIYDNKQRVRASALSCVG